MLLQAMRAREKRLTHLLLGDETPSPTKAADGGAQDDATGGATSDTLLQQQKMARELGYRAQLRFEQQRESLTQLHKGQARALARPRGAPACIRTG